MILLDTNIIIPIINAKWIPPVIRSALQDSIDQEGEAIDDEALNRILVITEGYPYVLQEWGKHSWNTAVQSPIKARDVEHASSARSLSAPHSCSSLVSRSCGTGAASRAI